MPSVRWKLLAVAVICLTCTTISARKERKEIFEDGWRPIIGHRDPSKTEQITQYRNPSSMEAVKVEAHVSTSEPILPPQSPPPKPTVTTTVKNVNHQHNRRQPSHKVPSHTKHQHINFVMNQGHGSQIPINTMTHRSQNKPYKMAVMGKTHPPIFNGKRPMKPIRMQVGAHSNREEIFAAAPSSAIGNYAYFTQSQSPVKTRLTQPHSHMDFVNRFNPSEELFHLQRLPVQQYVLSKYPTQNDVHYTFQAQSDEYTRNLVPPLPSKEFQVDKEKEKSAFKQKDQPVTDQQGTKSDVVQTQTSVIPENILVQVPPPFTPQTYYVHENQNDQTVDVQVTKEKLKVFHNNIPINYNPQNDFGGFQYVRKPSEAPKPATYEVTEGKVWQQTPVFHFQYSRDPNRTKRPQIMQAQIENVVHFLPTPMKPERLAPTSPTQNDISTIYSELSHINKQKEKDPSLFTVKEVSTHYPILGQPNFNHHQVQFALSNKDSSEYINEITTMRTKQQIVEQNEDASQTTKVLDLTTLPPRNWQQKRKPSHRRRKPVNRNRLPSSEESENSTDNDVEKSAIEIQTVMPKERRRRPSRYRTTEATLIAEERPIRWQRPKSSEESIEMPYNHKFTTIKYQKPLRSQSNYDEQYEKTTDSELEQSSENHYTKFGKYDDDKNLGIYERPKLRRTRPYVTNDYERPTNEYESPANNYKHSTNNYERSTSKYERPTNYRFKQESEEERSSESFSEEKYQIEEMDPEDSQEQTEEDVDKLTEKSHTTHTKKPSTTALTTELSPTTNIRGPENEVDSTINPIRADNQETITIEEIHTQESDRTAESTTAIPTTTTTTTATTTTVEPTTKLNRLRRPSNYKSSPRPRFSVKEYRQRLNQYTSTTTDSTRSTEATTRSKYPYRSRKPIIRFQPEIKDAAEEITTEVSKTKFVPKSPRYGSTTESKMEDAEKVIKTTNSRLRPFGRSRSTTTTTETSTTQKISIKPNIFSSHRRPPQLSLRNRIYNRYNRNSTTTTKSPDSVETLDGETSDAIESTEDLDKSTKDFQKQSVYNTEKKETTETTTITSRTTASTEKNDLDNVDIPENEAVLQSQRVSDLTSSAQNDYNTPGVFKSVSPNVRRVPSYFTISTDDPILPIEAFFTNINKENGKAKRNS